MILRRHSVTFRLASWLTVFVLLVQSSAPMSHHSADETPGQLAFAKAFELCLAPGSAVPATPNEQDKSPHPNTDCAICQAVHAIGSFAPPAELVFVSLQDHRIDFAVSGDSWITQRSAQTSYQPRAPPFLA